MARKEDTEDSGLSELRGVVADLKELKAAISFARDQHGTWQMPSPTLPENVSWNFTTFEKFINQRFSDLSLLLRERYESQNTGLTAALAAAEKAVMAALIAAEKAVDKAEGAQHLRNEAQNEFRKSLADLSGLMWTIKEGTAAVDSLRRELGAVQSAQALSLSALQQANANIQGRIWGVSALFAIVTLAVTFGARFIGH